MKWLTEFLRESAGQDLIEYALLAATVALGLVFAMQLFRNVVSTTPSSPGVQRGS